jgi:hypothetical protein
MSLADLMNIERGRIRGGNVPRVLAELVQHFIMLDGCKEEGVFRISASTDDLQDKQKRLDQGDFSVVQELSIHEVTALIKRFLRAIPGGLIPSYTRCITAPNGSETHIEAIWKDLPVDNQALLKYMAKLAELLLRHEKETKMGMQGLMVVWAPWILCAPDDKTALMNYGKELEFAASFFRWAIAKFSGEDVDLVPKQVEWNAQATVAHRPAAVALCGGCGEPVRDDSFRVLGRCWHTSCAQMTSPRHPSSPPPRSSPAARKRSIRGDEQEARSPLVMQSTSANKGLKAKKGSSPHSSVDRMSAATPREDN